MMHSTAPVAPVSLPSRIAHSRICAMCVMTLLFFPLVVCVSPQETARQAWYMYYSWNDCYYTPREFKTLEEAVSTIKLLEPKIRSCNPQTGLYRMIDLQVDKYGLIFKTQWSTSQTRYVVNPVTTYGVNSAGMYSNTTYVGRNVTTTDSGLDHHSIIFRNIGYINLRNDKDPRQCSWTVVICNPTGIVQATLCATDRQSAQDMINSVYTLAKKGGTTIGARRLLGIYCQAITPQQQATLGTDTLQGVVISGVWIDSPAEKAGLQTNDIITHIDGNPVKNQHELKAEVGKNKRGRVKVAFHRLLEFNEARNAYDHEKFEKLIPLQ
jgi:hypothetical protein